MSTETSLERIPAEQAPHLDLKERRKVDTLRRRIRYLESLERANSWDLAELAALKWAVRKVLNP